MSDPILLRVLRPYASAEEYIAAESWSMSAKGMLLIGQEPLAPDTIVRFDVALENGDKVVRAEAKVVRHVPASGERPAGLQVRFRRFGAATKEFLDRAIAARPASIAPPRDKLPSIPEAEALSVPVPDVVVDSGPEVSITQSVPAADLTPLPLPAEASRADAPEARATGPAPEPEPASERQAAAPGEARVEQSGVRHRVVAPVPAPPDRDQLLARLRARRPA